MTILIIVTVCYTLYKSGAAAWFLNKIRLDTEPDHIPKTATAPPTEKQKEIITDREKLEKQAHYILTMQKYEYPETTAYMSDTMLLQIINNFCKN